MPRSSVLRRAVENEEMAPVQPGDAKLGSRDNLGNWTLLPHLFPPQPGYSGVDPGRVETLLREAGSSGAEDKRRAESQARIAASMARAPTMLSARVRL